MPMRMRLPARGRVVARPAEWSAAPAFLRIPPSSVRFDLDVVDRGALGRNRRRRVEVPEGQPRLVVDEIRIAASCRPLRFALQHLERLDRFDRALLAAEAGDVPARPAVGRLRVDERARAVVRTEMAARRLVVHARVAEIDRGVEADERRVPAPLHDAERFERGADRAGFARMRMHANARRSGTRALM